MPTADHSPESVVRALQKLRMRLGPKVKEICNPRLSTAWTNDWHTALLDIEKENTSRPEVSISLVGGTGSGKSTLLNAMLGKRMLPVSNMRACTAAITEVAYAEGARYHAEVSFVPRSEWEKEIENLLRDMDDLASAAASDGDTADVAGISREARAKIRAVYQVPEDAPLERYHLTRLREPPEIKRALNEGKTEIESDDFEEFRTRVRGYLESSGSYWPIVNTVRIRGPFNALRSGVKLVDLPGVNDPNEAREAVTKNYLKTCRFVWIVFNIKRTLTKDVHSIMQSDDFMRQVVMDGRESALTFVGTASDDLDIDSGREEFRLSEDCADVDVVLARNKAARESVRKNLQDLARSLAERAGDPKRAAAVAESFLRCSVFTVSAKDYLALSKPAKIRKSILDTNQQTEIPALLDHMEQISANYGIEAQSRSLHRRISLVLDEIHKYLLAEKASLDKSAHFSEGRRKEMAGAIDRLAAFLARTLEDHHERYTQDLVASQELLAERLKRAIERGAIELQHIVQGWNRIHWCTMRAISRRSGKYNSPTSGWYDLPAEIAKPILDGITFAWTDFFGDQMKQRLEKWTDKLLLAADRHGVDLLKDLSRIVPEASQQRLHEDFRDVVDATERVIKELVGQSRSRMQKLLDDVRRDLYDEIPYQIGVDMREAFEGASKEHGTGMKSRMITLIAQHAHSISTVMFTRTEERIGEGVRELVNSLTNAFQQMTDTIKKHTAIPVQNLANAEKIPERDLAAMQDEVASWSSVVLELQSDADILGGHALSHPSPAPTTTRSSAPTSKSTSSKAKRKPRP